MTIGQAVALILLFAFVGFLYWVFREPKEKVSPKIIEQIADIEPASVVRCRECRGLLWHIGHLPPCPECGAWAWVSAEWAFPGDGEGCKQTTANPNHP